MKSFLTCIRNLSVKLVIQLTFLTREVISLYFYTQSCFCVKDHKDLNVRIRQHPEYKGLKKYTSQTADYNALLVGHEMNLVLFTEK